MIVPRKSGPYFLIMGEEKSLYDTLSVHSEEMHGIVNSPGAEGWIFQGTLLLTWFNFNPSKDK